MLPRMLLLTLFFLRYCNEFGPINPSTCYCNEMIYFLHTLSLNDNISSFMTITDEIYSEMCMRSVKGCSKYSIIDNLIQFLA